MKRLTIILIAIMTITSVYGQEDNSTVQRNEVFLKAGFGTSWVILPKVFLVDEDVPTTNAQVLPATNGFSGFVGLQTVFHLGDGWLFTPEIDLSYSGGEIRVNRTTINGTDTLPSSVQRLQSYVRAEIPLHFGVRSRDGFWVTFGPSLYFTLYDNKGFNEAVAADPIDPADPAQVNSDNPFGVRFRLAAYAPVGERGYIDIKFESDLGQNFDYNNNTYEAKFSMQNLSIGYGYWLNKK
jgi:hypothetical protein